MDDLASIAAAGTIIELNGRSYIAKPLMLTDIATLRQWVADQVDKMPNPFRHLATDLDGIPADIRQRLADQAFEAARSRRELGSPEADAVLNSNDGMATIFWLSIRGAEPSVTREFLKGQIEAASLESIKNALLAINRINGWVDPEGNALSQLTSRPSPSTGETSSGGSASIGSSRPSSSAE